MAHHGRGPSRRAFGHLLLALALGAPVALAVLPVPPAAAAGLTVTNCANSGPGSLRQAVAGASSGDSITFALSPACSTITDPTGTILILTDMTITGPGAAALTISGNGTNGIFQVAPGVTATVSGFTLDDAVAADGGAVENNGNLTLTDSAVTGNAAVGTPSAVGDGGGIWNGTGSLTLTGDTVSDNNADGDGGGIENAGGTVTLTDSTLSGNTASANGVQGGGIDNHGTLTLTGSTISDNSDFPTSGALSEGGGIWNGDGDTVTVTDSTLSGNTAGGSDVADSSLGGAIENDNGDVSLTDSTVAGNKASSSTSNGNSDGGGIYSEGNNSGGVVTLTDSTLSGNTAAGEFSLGGGIFSVSNNTTGDTVIVTDSTLSGNTTSGPDGQGFGAALYNGHNSTLTVTNSTVAGNMNDTSAGPSGGGIYNGTDAAAVTLTATIVADNGSDGDCGGGSVTDKGYNIDDDGSCAFTLPSISDYATLGRTLGPLADNGGPTETVALLPANPAIDYVPGADCPATDQRGLARSAPCDIGAYDTDGSIPPPPTPTIAKIKPARGKVGRKVTITGTNLSRAALVSFHGTLAVIRTDTSTAITTTVPAGATTGTISVTTPSGTVLSAKAFKVTSRA